MRLFLFFLMTLPLVAQDVFIAKPYLQLGNFPSIKDSDKMSLLWHTTGEKHAFTVVARTAGAKNWSKPVEASWQRIRVRTIEDHLVWTANLKGLKPGVEFNYQVLRDGKMVFEATAKARKSAAQPYRFAAFGDIAQDTPEQRAVAHQMGAAKPDFVFVAGDIVYGRGRISEYRQKYFPVYNSDENAALKGAPLSRSTLFIAAPGNHDTATQDLKLYPDAQAYFYYWNQPLNGPVMPGLRLAPVIKGDEADIAATKMSAGVKFPQMASFSFDYGNAHWLVLDSNDYVDFLNPKLREWIQNDLASSKAQWKFVGFHHPGFNSSKAHFKEQRLRQLSGIFEQTHVDVVFAGHVHNYQRSFPMTFIPESTKPSKGEVCGFWTLDKQFGQNGNTKPKGVIYLVTGAGGAKLYDPEQEKHSESWQQFTDKFISSVNSFSLVDIAGGRLTMRQVDKDGKDVDQFVIEK